MEIQVTIPLSRLLEMQRRIRQVVDAYEHMRTIDPVEPFTSSLQNLRRTLASDWLEEEEE